MPWTYDDPPDVAKSWSDEDIRKCVDAANAVLEDGGTDEEAIYACIHAAGKSEDDRDMSDKRELRIVPASRLEVRSEGDGERKIIGYAAVFNSWSEDLGGFIEQVVPGAFLKTLNTADIRATFNHNPDYVLGRTNAGTLRLHEDDVGLVMEITPPDTQWARDLMKSIERGDVDQSSFMFHVIRDAWEEPASAADLARRTLLEVDLRDVSVVTYPAYPATQVQLRSLFGEDLYVPEPPSFDGGQADAVGDGSDEHRADAGMQERIRAAAARERILTLIEKTL